MADLTLSRFDAQQGGFIIPIHVIVDQYAVMTSILDN